ncbi:isopenicillin N synthase family oxygenase [Leptolyngbya cf. ectocarpi LEGE 11479]|uniref:Isopenicillin N synthase family oxygenase n=1 Tax=Leptolyngbya cf. ectocarpi LEGE 11479 TaxID=1828722 RepID=A0A928X0M3_LEPEC|nr:isopenicillin N synthase family oxygenase [Leptolyngbya ectocarpi]MBE9065344.1 isopenicillin N synthase family oxygenase [Leptolyngbya cf. ectocarpi LEGE 11479]
MPIAALPILNLQTFLHGSPIQQQHFVRTLGEALETVGFFALEHHDIDADLIQLAYGAAADFFTLPAATKQTYERPEIHRQRGFTRFGQEHAKDNQAPDLKEFWHVGREKELINPWPREVPQFQWAMSQLYTQLETCAAQLLRACALYLDLPENTFDEEATQGKSILRVLHYPPLLESEQGGGLRAAPHEDINLITLLCESTGPGLELQQTDGSWLAIESLPGQIIVDTGDMLQALSNGVFKSTTHRVVNGDLQNTRRFSLPFFMHPRPDFDLTPLPNCVERTGGQLKFPSQTAGQYLQQRLQEIGLA